MCDVRTDLHPYAAPILEHFARNTPGSLLKKFKQITWNSLRFDWPDSLEGFLGARPSLCLETPLLGRDVWPGFDGSTDPERAYYRIATHDPSVRYGGFRMEANATRAVQMMEKLGIKLKPWEKPNPDGHILFALQVPRDTSLKGLDILEAAAWDLFELHRTTNSPVVVSLHPDCHKGFGAGRVDQDKLSNLYTVASATGAKILGPSEKSRDYFDGARFVMAYTSGITTEAAIEGVWVKPLHRGAFAYPMLDRGIRAEWISELAHIQYSWAEIERGEHLATVEWLARE